MSQSAYKRNWSTFLHLIEEAYNEKPFNSAMWQHYHNKETWKSLPETDMYSLRHSYCSTLYDAGVDVKTAQKLMGHDDLEVTMKIYTHLSEKKKESSYDALFRHFGVENRE